MSSAVRKPPEPVSISAYLAWSESQADGARTELIDGRIVSMSPERVDHLTAKLAVSVAFGRAIQKGKLPCRVLPDGATVPVSKTSAFQPDVTVHCGPELKPDALLIESPLIVVEVVSPSSGGRDAGEKLSGYFRVPGIQHYLIVYPARRMAVHHQRPAAGETLATRIFTEGEIVFDPPGLSVALVELFDDPFGAG